MVADEPRLLSPGSGVWSQAAADAVRGDRQRGHQAGFVASQARDHDAQGGDHVLAAADWDSNRAGAQRHLFRSRRVAVGPDLAELGTESSVVGVARLYAPWAGTLVIDAADAARAAEVEAEGMRCVVTETVMSTPEKAAALARVVLDAGR